MLRPIEYVYLVVVLYIMYQQVSSGIYDPIALSFVALFTGLIATNRRESAGEDTVITRIAKKVLEPSDSGGKDEEE